MKKNAPSTSWKQHFNTKESQTGCVCECVCRNVLVSVMLIELRQTRQYTGEHAVQIKPDATPTVAP